MRLTKVLWPIIIVCSALAALMAMRFFPSLPERPLFIMWFLFICPGMALVRFFHLKELVVKLSLAVALSFSIDGIVVGIYLYAGHWSPLAMMLTLVVSSIVAVVIELTNVHVIVYNHVSFIRGFGTLLTHPLIIGTSSVMLQSVGSLDVSDESTIRVVPVNSIPGLLANAVPMDIEEKPTVQMAKAQLSSAAARDIDIEEKPTVQMAKAQLSSAGRERFENQSTVQMAIPFDPSQAQRRAVWSPNEPQVPPAKRPHAEKTSENVDIKQNVDIEQKNTLHIGSASATPQIAHEDVDRTVPVSKSRWMQGQSTTENSFPEGDDIEERATRHTADVVLSEQADIDDPNTQKFSGDNAGTSAQRLANGEEGRMGPVTNTQTHRKKRFPTRFTRIEQ